jgi:hypothetical protein
MPVIKKKKSKKPLVVKISKPTKALAKKTKNTPEYYECLSALTSQGIKGTNIAQACHDCKEKSSALIKRRKQELKK